MKFGNAVHKIAQPFRTGVRFTVPFFIRGCIPKPEVRAQVDDPGSTLGKEVEPMSCRTMRERQKQEIARFERRE
jgi:hypothetical protein